MVNKNWSNHLFRGVLQSEDGVISRVLASEPDRLTFEAAFRGNGGFVERFSRQPEDFIFSERSRIARLGIQIKAEPVRPRVQGGGAVACTFSASSAIYGYPPLSAFAPFFCEGFPIGRLVFCDPEALLSSGEVLEALARSLLKLPEATSITSDGVIVIAPHKSVFHLRQGLDPDTIGRILTLEEGRDILNRFQVEEPVTAVTVPPGKGVITTCSMYLNDHYVVLESGSDLGRHLPATILDPIKTRGVRIYLEITNESAQPIVNPLIRAKIYRAGPARLHPVRRPRTSNRGYALYDFEKMQVLLRRFSGAGRRATCHYLDKPAAVVHNGDGDLEQAPVLFNGPAQPCALTRAECAGARRDFTAASRCPHRYATARIHHLLAGKASSIVLKYFPNLLEHRDIVNLAVAGQVNSLYFFEPSCEHGPFLSQLDHNRLQEYHSFGIDVHWVSHLTRRVMTHTMREGMGYFVVPERLVDFHRSMLFAFYGSNRDLSDNAVQRLGALMDALIAFWGKNIGIVTGGGSGVMGLANTFAKQRGILSGANFLDITDQEMTTDVDFCQMFQDKCRHSRQKWFEVTSFPIFNVGGIGTLEELGITLCNMKLAITDPVPVILFDTEGDGRYWVDILRQIHVMVAEKRAPAWIKDKLVMTNDPVRVIEAFRRHLQLF